MIFEHFALNVPDATAHAQWNVDHLGFRVLRRMTAAPFTHFLADDTGRPIVELYSNPAAPMTDFAATAPLTFHYALRTEDAAAERDRLLAAGASHVVDERLPDGSLLVMLRDPWGVPLQLCQRANPF